MDNENGQKKNMLGHTHKHSNPYFLKNKDSRK